MITDRSDNSGDLGQLYVTATQDELEWIQHTWQASLLAAESTSLRKVPHFILKVLTTS